MVFSCSTDKQDHSLDADVHVCDKASGAESNVAVGGESEKRDQTLVTSVEERNHETRPEKATKTLKADEQWTEEAETSEKSVIIESSSDLKPAEEGKEEGMKGTDKASCVARDQPVVLGDEKESSEALPSQEEEPLATKTREQEGEGEVKSDGAATESRRVEPPMPQPVHCQFST